MSDDAPRFPAFRRLLLWSAGLGIGIVAGLLAGRDPRREEVAAPRPRASFPRDQRSGAAGAGGYFSLWPLASADGAVAEHIEYQYAGIRHQKETALSGMWLFLITELLFFGALFLLYMIYRRFHPVGFASASSHARLLIGTINTVLLITSSAAFTVGFGHARQGDNRMLFRACVLTMVLGIAFLALKAYEWKLDLGDHLFPGPRFALTGPDAGGAQLFWSFYFVATGLHGIHMIVGIGLVAWIAVSARRLRFSPDYTAPVEVVGLYWSFVDMVWLCLYPMIYLVHPGGA